MRQSSKIGHCTFEKDWGWGEWGRGYGGSLHKNKTAANIKVIALLDFHHWKSANQRQFPAPNILLKF